MSEDLVLTCTLCPEACRLEVSYNPEENKLIEVNGYGCERGRSYVEEEVTNPRRSVMTVVPVQEQKTQVVSLLTSRPVPREQVHEVYQKMKSLRPELPVSRGEVLVENVCETEADVVATRSLEA